MSAAPSSGALPPDQNARAGLSLPLFHNIAGQPVLVLGEGAAAEAKARIVARAGGVVTDDFARAVDQGVRLAFIAFDDQAASAAAAINARCAGMLVNVVDRPELCDFTTPAIVDRAPLLVAVGTGGASAGLAKHVRLRLERLLPATIGDLAQGLESARALLRARWPDPRGRRAALDAALCEGGPLDPFGPATAQHVADWAAQAGGAGDDSGSSRRGAGIHFLTVTSSDPEDLTLRQARLLGEADLLLVERAVPEAIVKRARADAVRRWWQETGAAEEAAMREAQALGASLTLVLSWRGEPG